MTIILTLLSLKVSSFYFRTEKLKYKLKGLYPQLIFDVATYGGWQKGVSRLYG